MNQNDIFPGDPLCAEQFRVLVPTDLVTVPYAATVTIDAAKGTRCLHKIGNLTGNLTLAFVTANLAVGSAGEIFLKQDPTGGRTLTLPTPKAQTGTFTFTTTANAESRLTWMWDGARYIFGCTLLS